MKIAVSLELVCKLFSKVKAYHKLRETLYLKVRIAVDVSIYVISIQYATEIAGLIKDF